MNNPRDDIEFILKQNSSLLDLEVISLKVKEEDFIMTLHKVDDLVDDFTGMLRVRSHLGSRLGCHFTRGQMLINSIGKRIYLQIP